MNRPFLAMLAALLMVSGCAQLQIVETPQLSATVVSTPEIGSELTVRKGGVLYSQSRQYTTTGYVIGKTVTIPSSLGKIAVMEGDFLTVGLLGKDTVYCTEGKAYFDIYGNEADTACFLDRDRDAGFERATVAPGYIWFEREVSPPLPYALTEVATATAETYRGDLVYKGMSGSTVVLAYREYLGPQAILTFVEDLPVEFTGTPVVVTFRSLAVELLSADQNQLTYRLLSGLD